jgi:hypothetical protein
MNQEIWWFFLMKKTEVNNLTPPSLKVRHAIKNQEKVQ